MAGGHISHNIYCHYWFSDMLLLFVFLIYLLEYVLKQTIQYIDDDYNVVVFNRQLTFTDKINLSFRP